MTNNNQDIKKDSMDMAAFGDALPNSSLLAEGKAGLAELGHVVKTKLQSLPEQPSGFLEKLKTRVRKRVEFLREMQGQHDELEAKFLEEKFALEAKYQKMYDPLFTKRFEIVNGVVEVDGNSNESSTDKDENNVPEVKGVPDFWLNAMKTNEALSEEISERDEAALKYLKDIKWCRIENPKGFKLKFFFDTNPYFKNLVLMKTYHMIDDDEPILEKATGTEIEWYPGKCLTHKLLKKKPRKGAKNAKPITKTENCESFFNFFNPPQIPDEEDDIDEDAAEELQNQMEQDYEVGSTIRDKIIPHAVSWFTGEAIQDEFGDLDEDGEGEDEDEEDEDESDDYDDDDGGKKAKKMSLSGGKGGMQQAQEGERPPECKQQ